MDDTIPQDIPQKQCKECKEWYPATSAYFHKKASNRDKLQKKCKKCCGSSRLGISYVPVEDDMKRCTKCLKILPATSDYFQKHSDGGLQPRCKICRSEDQAEYYSNHKEQTHARTKRYRENNQEKVIAQRKLYWASHGKEIEARRKASLEANSDKKAKRLQQHKQTYYNRREKLIVKHRQYYALHKERKQVTSRAYYLKNRDRELALGRKYYALHREESYARGHKRRALQRKIAGTYTSVQIAEQLKRQRYRCYYCRNKFQKIKGRYRYHIEHTFPLSRVVGTDIPANDMSYLVLACPTCNLKKNNKFPWEFPEGGRLL